MIGDKERMQVKQRGTEILDKVAIELSTLKKIDPAYAKRILQIFSYPENAGNLSYVSKIIQNSEKLGICTNLRNDIHLFNENQIRKNIRNNANASNVSAIFITNPIASHINGEQYQGIVNLTGPKDIDGGSYINRAKLNDVTATLEGAIIHPTALSVLLLVQKTLDTTDLHGKTILVAGKNGNFGSMIASLLERVGAKTIGFNPKVDDKDTRHHNIKNADAMVSVIRGANYFKQEHFEGFGGPIIDVTTEADSIGKTVGSVDIQNCKDMQNIYIPSINGGVGTTTSALLMGNFPICTINTEIAKGVKSEKFEDLSDTISYNRFGLNAIQEAH